MTEECFFFDADRPGAQLYGACYLPDAPNGLAVLVVHTLGRERLRLYAEVANLGRALAGQGIALLRFDYGGEGESSGRFEEATITSRCSDLRRAAAELRRRTPVDRLCLLSLHFGSALALLLAAELGATELVLCDPILDVQRYVKDLFRSNIILQRQYHGAIVADEERLRKTIAAGGGVSLFGFHLTRPLLAELEGLELRAPAQRFTGRAALLYFAKQQGAPPRREIETLRQLLATAGTAELQPLVAPTFSWGTRTWWGTHLAPLEEAVSHWLLRPAAEGEVR